MTEEELVAMTMATKVSGVTGNLMLFPPVLVHHVPTNKAVNVRAIGRKTEHLGHVKTDDGLWIPIESIALTKK